MSDEKRDSGITLSVTNGRTLDVNCMSEVEIPDSDIAIVHLADVISGGIMDKLRGFPQGRVPGGKYVIKMTAVLTPVPEENNAVPETKDK